ncbi:hypothetical protein F4553_005283 [Allocatelliglobosispora scoriae]|uniref:Uncharacterized protein n=1 Tax=Allocatelliglobosispora scoriae TaxID=643052 RepID=A0A841BUM6_9ACTN|nr:hypothetical protein [Allocatelliglobosispora scoriae]MBB5871904.1 hypothetical protein [Allocatelliglobosispora scoriae]
MANVNIYPAHRAILDSLITTGKAKSVAAGTKTGPFREMREAYVFAASLALALNQPTPADQIPASKKDVLPIQDRVFLGAEGAVELAAAAVLTSADDGDVARESLRSQLDLLSEQKLIERLALLDRYAYAGFEWLREQQKDESGVRDLVLSAIDSVDCVLREVGDDSAVQDPLWSLLGLKSVVI